MMDVLAVAGVKAQKARDKGPAVGRDEGEMVACLLLGAW